MSTAIITHNGVGDISLDAVVQCDTNMMAGGLRQDAVYRLVISETRLMQLGAKESHRCLELFRAYCECRGLEWEVRPDPRNRRTVVMIRNPIERPSAQRTYPQLT